MIHADGMQVGSDYPLIITRATAVEQPLSLTRSDVDGRAGPDIEHGDLGHELFWPMRMGHVKMSARYLSKELDKRENHFA
jgi:hypothetical protein